jgi:hypothetical protein
MPLSHPWCQPQMLFTLAVSLLLCACAQVGRAGADTWKEEVQLHDGQKVVVERSQNYGGRHEVGQSSPVKEHTISLALPNVSRSISWTSEYAEDAGVTNFNLLALHLKDGVPYLVASPNLCISYNKWGRPNPPYISFKYDGSQWIRIAMEELPVEFKSINLIVDTYEQRDIREKSRDAGFVPAEAVVRFNEELRGPELRTIVREALPPSRIQCPVLKRYRCGWGAPGDFNDKYFDLSCK